jgi:signal transduction histidine kinase
MAYVSGTSPIDSVDQTADIMGELLPKKRTKSPAGAAAAASRVERRGHMRETMRRKLIRLSRLYASTLLRHLKQPQPGSLDLARGLGRQALRLGFEMLDLARIHAAALASPEISRCRYGSLRRAEAFFTEALSPIEETHRAALITNARLTRVNTTLDRRTQALAVSNRSLTQSVARCKTAEQTLRKNGAQAKQMLQESVRMQRHLRHLTRRALASQEDKRKKVSRDLQDEIAQTLLGINVRLLTLKKAAGHNDSGLQKEIASTQRLVAQSVRTINLFARELEIHQRPARA